MLLFFVLACNRREPFIPPEDSAAAPSQTETGTVPVDTDPPEPEYNAWDDPAWWTQEGPFAPLLDLPKETTRPHWEAWMTTSTDLKTWTKGVPFAYNISSMDVLVIEDKGVILTTSIAPDPDLKLAIPFENLFLFMTTDLQTWGTRMVPIKDAAEPMIIDPSMHWTPEGRLRLVYYGSSLDVDPKKLPDDYPNPHAIFEAWWDGEQFVQESDVPLLEADYVVDPSGCYHEGTHYMLGTRRYEELYFVKRDGDDAEFEPVFKTGNWPGVQVPYCYDQEKRPIFLAQYGGGEGPPFMRRLRDDGTLTEAEEIFSLDDVGYNGCTTPVMGHFNETYFLICATWVQ